MKTWRRGRYHCSHFTDEAETQRGDVPYIKSHSWEGAELDFEPISVCANGILLRFQSLGEKSPEIFYSYGLKKVLLEESVCLAHSRCTILLVRVNGSLQRTPFSLQHLPLSGQYWEVWSWVLFLPGCWQQTLPYSDLSSVPVLHGGGSLRKLFPRKSCAFSKSPELSAQPPCSQRLPLWVSKQPHSPAG